MTLAEVDAGPITSVAVFPGGAKAVAKGLKALGLAMPGAEQLCRKEGRADRLDRARPGLSDRGRSRPALEGAAVTDQSRRLGGAGAVRARARWMCWRGWCRWTCGWRPFRWGGRFGRGLNHMNAVILRTGDHAFEIMVFRSMARTAWHEIETAMQYGGGARRRRNSRRKARKAEEFVTGVSSGSVFTPFLKQSFRKGARWPPTDRPWPPMSMTPNRSPRPRGPRSTGC